MDNELGDAESPIRLSPSPGAFIAKPAADGQSAELFDREGQKVLDYEKLKVWDSAGTLLAARIVSDDTGLGIEVADQDATYPVTIDPSFTQRSKLTRPDSAAGDISANDGPGRKQARDRRSDAAAAATMARGCVYI